MSAPDTRLSKQRRRHWFVLLGIGAAAVFGVLMIFLGSVAYVTDDEEGSMRDNAEEVVGAERSISDDPEASSRSEPARTPADDPSPTPLIDPDMAE